MECLSILSDLKYDKSNLSYLEEYKNILSTKNINITYEKDGYRAILYINKHEKPISPIMRECSGIVIDHVKCTVLAYPPPPVIFTNCEDITQIENIDEMNLYKIDDGTTIMLYYDQKWCYATNRAIDVSEMYQYGHKITYGDALKQSLEQYQFSFDHLDKNVSYTIGFHHDILHPHRSKSSGPEYRAWFIAAYDHQGNQIECDIGIPKQERDTIPVSCVIEYTTDAKFNWLNEKGVDYGFIFEGNNVRYMIESSLLRAIRNTYYNNKIMKELYENEICHKEIYLCTKYAIARSNTITTLFPHFQETYDNIIDIMETAIESITCQVDGNEKPMTHMSKFTYDGLTRICSNTTLIKHKHIIREYVYSENTLMPIYRHLISFK